MVETITPVVHGGRARWLGTLVLHTLGATVTAAAFGASLGWVGGLSGAPWGRPSLFVLAAVGAAYAIAELPLRRPLPVPQLRRQVPDWWRTFFGRPVAAVLYGAGLGVGFFTYLAHGTFVVVTFAAVAGGRPGTGALVVAPFGLVRGLSAATAWRSDTPEQSQALLDRLVSAPESRRKVANALALVTVLGAAALAATRAPRGDWPALAAAAMAIVFSWSAVSKVAGFSGWRQALAGHRLPSYAERIATWSAPVGEAFVPLLVVMGSARTAGAWALSLLALFSIELIRIRGFVGARVPCGCFGGPAAIDFRTALMRNAGLGALCTVVTLFGHDRPVVRWPGVPGAVDLGPSMLALGAVLAAALTAWRASSWLSKSRRA